MGFPQRIDTIFELNRTDLNYAHKKRHHKKHGLCVLRERKRKEKKVTYVDKGVITRNMGYARSQKASSQEEQVVYAHKTNATTRAASQAWPLSFFSCLHYQTVTSLESHGHRC